MTLYERIFGRVNGISDRHAADKVFVDHVERLEANHTELMRSLEMRITALEDAKTAPETAKRTAAK